MDAAYIKKDRVAEKIYMFWFNPIKKPGFQAGQFTQIILPHENSDDRGYKRWFTISSSPTEQNLAITTKLDSSPSSFKSHLFDLTPGQVVNFSEPMGDFVLPMDSKQPLVFVAGGIGITPMRSIAKYLSDKGLKRDITLLYGVKTETDLAYRDLFTVAEIDYIEIIQKPSSSWKGEAGSLDAQRVLSAGQKYTKPMYFISGPEPMVESLYKQMHARGIPDYRIVTDYFHNYAAV